LTGNREIGRARVLVASSSKHGSTEEIAHRIADTIAAEGHDVTKTVAGPDITIDQFDAIVLGSAVYAGKWMTDAIDLAGRIGREPDPPQVWLFSSGPVGDPPKPEPETVDVTELVEVTSAREHRVFSGKIDKSKLGFAERAIIVAVRAPEGDFRRWDEIETWSRSIAATLHLEEAVI
jgi:menaquinone-dependent protoporphyrinogen oxidase